MATPLVSGSAALLLSALVAQGSSPYGKVQLLKELLTTTGDPLAGLPTRSGRRLNLSAALAAASMVVGTAGVAVGPLQLDPRSTSLMVQGAREVYYDLQVCVEELAGGAATGAPPPPALHGAAFAAPGPAPGPQQSARCRPLLSRPQAARGNSSAARLPIDSSIRDDVFPMAGFKRSSGVLLQLSGHVHLDAPGTYIVQVRLWGGRGSVCVCVGCLASLAAGPRRAGQPLHEHAPPPPPYPRTRSAQQGPPACCRPWRMRC
jgi:hypothetical protein